MKLKINFVQKGKYRHLYKQVNKYSNIYAVYLFNVLFNFWLFIIYSDKWALKSILMYLRTV